jgi:hypothetical protein
LAIVVLFGWVGAVPAVAQEPIRWKFQQGETWEFLMSTITTSSVQGREEQAQVDLELVWKINAVDAAGNAEIEQSARRAVVRQGDQVLLDATDPEPQPGDTAAALGVRPLLNVRVGIRMSPLGNILDVRFSNDVKKWLRERMGLEETEARRGFAKEWLSFPSEQIQVGETWSVPAHSLVPDLGSVNSTVTYQYVGVETLDGKEVDKFKLSPSFQLQESDRDLKRQEGSGTMWFDRTAGRLLRSVSTQEFELQPAKTSGESSPRKNTTVTTVEWIGK